MALKLRISTFSLAATKAPNQKPEKIFKLQSREPWRAKAVSSGNPIDYLYRIK
jgi:hypothetical protein